MRERERGRERELRIGHSLMGVWHKCFSLPLRKRNEARNGQRRRRYCGQNCLFLFELKKTRPTVWRYTDDLLWVCAWNKSYFLWYENGAFIALSYLPQFALILKHFSLSTFCYFFFLPRQQLPELRKRKCKPKNNNKKEFILERREKKQPVFSSFFPGPQTFSLNYRLFSLGGS